MRGLLHRQHRVVNALAGVSFMLERGELLGFIGPNGAGKSTTIKILAGILRADGGRVEVDGRDPARQREQHVGRIGVVFGQRTQLWWDLAVGEGFDLLRDIYRVEPARYRRTRDELVALLRLERVLAQPVRQLSLGQRMRAEIAAALLHEPDLLFLDEPTIGLDAPSKLAVRDFVRRANRERGTTVLLTTLPRLALMTGFAALLLPLVGAGAWAWQAPAGLAAGLLFLVAGGLGLLLATALVMALNIATAAALNERGINAFAVPLVIVLSGNMLPLALLPDAWQDALLLQPLAGLMDIPARLYFGQLTGRDAVGALALQAAWIAPLVAGGRLALERTLRRLEVQGG